MYFSTAVFKQLEKVGSNLAPVLGKLPTNKKLVIPATDLTTNLKKLVKGMGVKDAKAIEIVKGPKGTFSFIVDGVPRIRLNDQGDGFTQIIRSGKKDHGLLLNANAGKRQQFYTSLKDHNPLKAEQLNDAVAGIKKLTKKGGDDLATIAEAATKKAAAAKKKAAKKP